MRLRDLSTACTVKTTVPVPRTKGIPRGSDLCLEFVPDAVTQGPATHSEPAIHECCPTATIAAPGPGHCEDAYIRRGMMVRIQSEDLNCPSPDSYSAQWRIKLRADHVGRSPNLWSPPDRSVRNRTTDMPSPASFPCAPPPNDEGSQARNVHAGFNPSQRAAHSSEGQRQEGTVRERSLRKLDRNAGRMKDVVGRCHTHFEQCDAGPTDVRCGRFPDGVHSAFRGNRDREGIPGCGAGVNEHSQLKRLSGRYQWDD